MIPPEDIPCCLPPRMLRARSGNKCSKIALSQRAVWQDGRRATHGSAQAELLRVSNESAQRRRCMGQKIDSRRIALIVEDDFELRGLAAALLEETDLRVIEMASAEEALDYLRSHAEEVAF